MTKKDYELIAGVISHRIAQVKLTRNDSQEIINSVIYWIVNDLCNELVNDNQRFDRDKFIKACGL